MNNREVAHRWANQVGSRATGSNFYYRGPSIFSYGGHFEIARLLDGEHLGHVFFTRRTYSVSTARHKSYTYSALHGSQTVWMVADFDDHAANVKAYLNDMEEARAKALKARKWAELHRRAAYTEARKAGEYALRFGTGGDRALKRRALAAKRTAENGKLFSPEEIAGFEKRAAAAAEAARVAEQKRQEREAVRRAEDMVKLDAWARGEEHYAPSRYSLPVRLRLEDEGTRVVTSRGARITTRTARALWAGLVNGETVVGLSLDGYTVNSWDGQTLVVGCHEIPASELARMAALLGLPGTLPGVCA